MVKQSQYSKHVMFVAENRMSSQLQTSLILHHQLMITSHWTRRHKESSLSTMSYNLINVTTLVIRLTFMKMLLLLN